MFVVATIGGNKIESENLNKEDKRHWELKVLYQTKKFVFEYSIDGEARKCIFNFSQIASIKIDANILEFHTFDYPRYSIKNGTKWKESNINLSSPQFIFHCASNLEDIKNLLIYVDPRI
jgi:hypothetical protein